MGEPTAPEDETAASDASDPRADYYRPAEEAGLAGGGFRPAEGTELVGGDYRPAEQTEPVGGDAWPEDETTRLTPEDLARPPGEPGGTVVMPTGDEAPGWSGRAGVPGPGGLRDSVPYQQGDPNQPRTWWTPILLGMLALGLVGIVILAAYMINSQPVHRPTPTITPAPQPTSTAQPATTAATPTGPPSATIQLAQVPAKLVGMTQDDATAALDAVGLAYSLSFQASDKPYGTVISSNPEPGKLVPVNSVVKLLISLGGPSPTPSESP